MVSGPKNQGEGNRTAAKAYDKATTAFVKSGRVAKNAEKAARALDGAEAQSLAQAEKAGRSRAKAEDPLLYKRK